jgi:hypothetical protein
MASTFGGRRFAIVVGLAALLSSAFAAAETTSDAGVDAVWKPQRLAFEYRGYSTVYSCRSLKRKLHDILLSIGAREDLRVSGYACDEQGSVASFEISFHSPVEATPENVRALTSYDSQDELIARTRGETLPSAQDLPRFPAVWKTVSFARDRELKLQPGDCELMEAVRRQILPRLSVRIVADRIRCSSAFGNIGPPRLTVTALVPAASRRADPIRG